jgi:hypothetical protein
LNVHGISAAEVADAEGADLADVLAQMLQGRESLTHGRCDVDFRLFRETADGFEERMFVTIDFAFDFRKDLMRFQQTLNSTKLESGKDVKDLPGAPMYSQVYVRGKDHSISYLPSYYAVTLRDRTKLPDEHLVRLFDPRSCGLVTHAQLTKFLSLSDAMKRYPAKGEGMSIKNSGELRQLQWLGDADRLERQVTLLIDPQRGFTPTRLEIAYRLKEEGAAPGAKNPWRQTDVGKPRWKLINNVWVPERWTVEWRPAPGRGVRLTYDFRWKNVNQRIDEDLFTLESLEIPQGAAVVNEVTGSSFMSIRSQDNESRFMKTSPRRNRISTYFEDKNASHPTSQNLICPTPILTEPGMPSTALWDEDVR